MWPLEMAQSLAQLIAVSPLSQVPLPHMGLGPPLSSGQLPLFSPLSHWPLGHLGPSGLQSCGQLSTFVALTGAVAA